MEIIRKERAAREDSGAEWEQADVAFTPTYGMAVRKMFEGRYYFGKVISTDPFNVTRPVTDSAKRDQTVPVWKVEYEDGDQEDMELDELLRVRIGRPRLPAPVRGRAFQMLELFSGRGIVTQAFFARQWKGMNQCGCHGRYVALASPRRP